MLLKKAYCIVYVVCIVFLLLYAYVYIFLISRFILLIAEAPAAQELQERWKLGDTLLRSLLSRLFQAFRVEKRNSTTRRKWNENHL